MAASRSTTTSPATRKARPRSPPSTCNCRSKPPAEALHLELLYFGNRESRPIDPETLALTWERFTRLVAHYQDAETPFVARLRPQKISWASDYDHLSRKGEWADGDEP